MKYEKKAVYAGSFDPITNGHVWMIKQGLKLFDKLVVAIGDNPHKQYTFSIPERISMLKKIAKEYQNIEVDAFNNKFLVKYAQSINAKYILRGIRSQVDYEFERGMRHINSDIDSNINTVFLMPPREITEISSSLVKGLIGSQGWMEVIEKYVPRNVLNNFIIHYDGMRRYWRELIKDLGLNFEHEDLYREIISMYTAGDRYYHNLVHLFRLFTHAEKFREHIEDFNSFRLAIWFHDVIIDYKGGNSELRSAEFAKKSLKNMGLKDDIIDNVYNLILSTSLDNIKRQGSDVLLFSDFEFIVLGRSYKDFLDFEKDCRYECLSLSDKEYKKIRLKELEKIRARENIYYSDLFQKLYSEKAKANLNILIRKLKSI